MNENNNFQGKLDSMINACALQAHWHHEQYVRLQYCQKYFIYLLHNKHFWEENYLEKFFQNITAPHPWSARGPKPWVHPSSDVKERTESSTSEVRCKRKKRKKKKNKRKKSQQIYENDDDDENESEDDLEVDEGFKEFLKESARFRAERGFFIVIFIFLFFY